MQMLPVTVAAERHPIQTSSPQPAQLEPRSAIDVSNLLPAEEAQPTLAVLPVRPSAVTPYATSSSTYSCRGETEYEAKRIVYMPDGSQCVALEEEVLGPNPTG